MDWAIRNWQDVGAIVSIASIFGFIIVFIQLKSGLNISNREKALDAYLEFSKKFDDLAEHNARNKVRFQSGDKSLGLPEVRKFFRDLWASHLHEWEFFQAGILPSRVYAQWIIYMHDYLTNGEGKGYYDETGTERNISNVDAFEAYGKALLRHHPDFLAFIAEIRNIAPDSAKDDGRIYRKICRILRRFRKREYWSFG